MEHRSRAARRRASYGIEHGGIDFRSPPRLASWIDQRNEDGLAAEARDRFILANRVARGGQRAEMPAARSIGRPASGLVRSNDDRREPPSQPRLCDEQRLKLRIRA